MLVGVLAAMMFVGTVHGQEFPQADKDLPHLTGAEVFVDLAQYAGKSGVITDGVGWGADNDGAYLHAGGCHLQSSYRRH